MSTARPVVTIELGGKTRTLKLDFNAQAELEDLRANWKSDAPSRKILRGTLWALMLHEMVDSKGKARPGFISEYEVGALLDAEGVDLEAISTAIASALGFSLPDAEPERPTTASPIEPTTVD